MHQHVSSPPARRTALSNASAAHITQPVVHRAQTSRSFDPHSREVPARLPIGIQHMQHERLQCHIHAAQSHCRLRLYTTTGSFDCVYVFFPGRRTRTRKAHWSASPRLRNQKQLPFPVVYIAELPRIAQQTLPRQEVCSLSVRCCTAPRDSLCFLPRRSARRTPRGQERTKYIYKNRWCIDRAGSRRGGPASLPRLPQQNSCGEAADLRLAKGRKQAKVSAHRSTCRTSLQGDDLRG